LLARSHPTRLSRARRYWFLNDCIKKSDASLRILRCTPLPLLQGAPAANADVSWEAYVGADALRALYASLDERGLDEQALRQAVRELLLEFGEVRSSFLLFASVLFLLFAHILFCLHLSFISGCMAGPRCVGRRRGERCGGRGGC
jgi:hypothetical protein